MPDPIAVMMARISSLDRILSIRARSTLRIFPLSGRIAWNSRSRPCLAEPPALSPSTRYSSDREALRLEQSASLPGRTPVSRADFFRVRSRALRAASRALAACTAFSMIRRADEGFSSSHVPSLSLIRLSTIPRTSLFPSFVLVCPSNWGSSTLTESTATRPSRTSSPDRLGSPFLAFLLP